MQRGMLSHLGKLIILSLCCGWLIYDNHICSCFLFVVFVLCFCFIFGCAGSLLRARTAPWLQGTGSSWRWPPCCGAWAPGAWTSVVGTRNTFNSCRSSRWGTQAYCSVTCAIFPHQGSNPCLLHRQVDSFPQPPGKPCLMFFVPLFSFSCCPSFKCLIWI